MCASHSVAGASPVSILPNTSSAGLYVYKVCMISLGEPRFDATRLSGHDLSETL